MTKSPEAVICDDGEGTVLVKHTHDVELAARLARQAYDVLDDGWMTPEEIERLNLGTPKQVWIRLSPCLPNSYGAGEGWKWTYNYAEQGHRGVFPAVEFRH